MSNNLKKKEKQLTVVQAKTELLQQEYTNELETNPKYSLEVDPENKYGMPEAQKNFVKQYVEFKNVNTAAELVGIDQDTAKQYFISFASQQEIRRINLALYHRQFATRLLTIDEIGGYLTCMLTGANVPIGDQLKTSEKLKVIDQLIKLNELKQNALQDPSVVMMNDIDVQIKNLSVATLGQLIAQSNMKEKQDIIKTYDVDGNLSPEEEAYLSTLPTSDLLQLIDETNKGVKKDDAK